MVNLYMLLTQIAVMTQIVVVQVYLYMWLEGRRNVTLNHALVCTEYTNVMSSPLGC